MYCYNRLRDLREDRDWTQTDVGKILGTTQKQYSRWETGESEIPFHNVIKLAKEYGISIDYIAGITDIPISLPNKKRGGEKMSEEFYPVFEMIRDKLYIPLISVPINEIINKGSALITILTINWIISYLIDEFKEYFSR